MSGDSLIQLEPTPSTPAQPPGDRLPSLLRPLRNRNYALLFTGQLSSLIGDQLYVVALPFLVLGHAGVRELGLVLMCFGIARIATVPIGGVLADRMDKRKLMLLTDFGARWPRGPVPAPLVRDLAGHPERRRTARW
jgi:predicted MFS family arabinose efflux permease